MLRVPPNWLLPGGWLPSHHRAFYPVHAPPCSYEACMLGGDKEAASTRPSCPPSWALVPTLLLDWGTGGGGQPHQDQAGQSSQTRAAQRCGL